MSGTDPGHAFDDDAVVGRQAGEDDLLFPRLWAGGNRRAPDPVLSVHGEQVGAALSRGERAPGDEQRVFQRTGAHAYAHVLSGDQAFGAVGKHAAQEERSGGGVHFWGDIVQFALNDEGAVPDLSMRGLSGLSKGRRVGFTEKRA